LPYLKTHPTWPTKNNPPLLQRTSASRPASPARGKIRNKKILSYGIFVCIAVAMWYIINLGKTYNTEIWVPVEYQNPPEGMVIAGDPGRKLLLGVRATGFGLLRSYVYSRIDPVVIMLNQYPLGNISSSSQQFILSRQLVPFVNQALGKDISVLRIYPDSLLFRFSPRKTVKVPVVPVLEVSYKRQHMAVGPVRLRPDSVYVAGPVALVDTLRAVYTEQFSREELSDTLTASLRLIEQPRLLYSFTQTEMTLPVEQYTESTLTVPIRVVNKPDSLSVHTFPAAVTVRCKVGISAYDTLSASLFSAQVDFRNLSSEGRNLKALVNITQSPPWISGVTISPSNVEYLIELP